MFESCAQGCKCGAVLPVSIILKTDFSVPCRLACGFAHPATQSFEVGPIGRCCRCRSGTREQKVAQVQAVLVLADQLTHVLTAGAVAALIDLLVHKGFERVG